MWVVNNMAAFLNVSWPVGAECRTRRSLLGLHGSGQAKRKMGKLLLTARADAHTFAHDDAFKTPLGNQGDVDIFVNDSVLKILLDSQGRC